MKRKIQSRRLSEGDEEKLPFYMQNHFSPVVCPVFVFTRRRVAQFLKEMSNRDAMLVYALRTIRDDIVTYLLSTTS